MNRINKFFVGVSIILAISLVIITGLYFKEIKIAKRSLNALLETSGILAETNSAIEKAGYRVKKQEDGSFVLVERTNE